MRTRRRVGLAASCLGASCEWGAALSAAGSGEERYEPERSAPVFVVMMITPPPAFVP